MSVFQIIENPEGIRELISRTTNDERLKALLCAMSCEDVEKRYSAKDALVKVTGWYLIVFS